MTRRRGNRIESARATVAGMNLRGWVNQAHARASNQGDRAEGRGGRVYARTAVAVASCCSVRKTSRGQRESACNRGRLIALISET